MYGMPMGVNFGMGMGGFGMNYPGSVPTPYQSVPIATPTATAATTTAATAPSTSASSVYKDDKPIAVDSSSLPLATTIPSNPSPSDRAVSSETDAGKAKDDANKNSTKAGLRIGEWQSYITREGNVYYYNLLTQTTTWNMPKEFEQSVATNTVNTVPSPHVDVHANANGVVMPSDNALSNPTTLTQSNRTEGGETQSNESQVLIETQSNVGVLTNTDANANVNVNVNVNANTSTSTSTNADATADIDIDIDADAKLNIQNEDETKRQSEHKAVPVVVVVEDLHLKNSVRVPLDTNTTLHNVPNGTFFFIFIFFYFVKKKSVIMRIIKHYKICEKQ
ncbi:laminin G, sub domain 2 [Reticulomyxa filosa]|uniref:Laminin G, sub domain 2 n=1 Tax=Reticulomyxa filosa TaxID=46433 RepID=X6NQ40_RETFI|nr:laminin G, sub domain 2 [Reticulomyxa filosa]|eukprot:ETO27477.1 laminin G, sub domain 2 [Reticulomyxa filosa]